MSQALAAPQTSTSAVALLRDDMEAALGFASQEKASATRAAYQSDFRIFSAYCDARGLAALPAAIDTVAAFISAEAKGGAKASTIGRRIAAIRYAHKLAGHEPQPMRRA